MRETLPDFHAQRSATGKRYRYCLDDGPVQAAGSAAVKVIIETALLTDAEKVREQQDDIGREQEARRGCVEEELVRHAWSLLGLSAAWGAAG